MSPALTKIGVFLCLSVWSVCCFAQAPFRVMHYNVENLFDCRDDSLKQDEEFLPRAVRAWTWKKYHEKVTKIAKVILAASGEQVPDLVGLCEVENAYCLDGLTKYSPLRDAAYRYVMTDSPDERGIDVALLYQPATFRLIGTECIRVPSGQIGRKPTRDILHVSGRVVSGDTLDVFVCHFPSRSGGARQSAPHRLLAASVLRQAADSVSAVRRNPYLIIMGDFNDYPSSPSVSEALGAKEVPRTDVSSSVLYNLMAGKAGGTYRYRGEWGMLDQFIVNGTMLSPSSALCTGADRPVRWHSLSFLKRTGNTGATRLSARIRACAITADIAIIFPFAWILRSDTEPHDVIVHVEAVSDVCVFFAHFFHAHVPVEA